MGGNNHAYNGSSGRKGNREAIEEPTACATLRMGALLIWRLLQTRLDSRQFPQIVVFAAHNHPQPTRDEQIGQRSRIAIQSVQAKQHLGEGQRQRCGIARDHFSCPQQFTAIIAISRASEGGQPLMRMCLQHGGASSYHDSF